MRSRLLLVLLLGSVSFSTTGQTDSASAERPWFVSLYSGALLGRPGSGSSISAMLMPGVRLNRVAIAVGAGYDGHLIWETLPVFAGVGYDVIRRNRHAFFAHFNAGYSRVWDRRPTGEIQTTYKHEGGYFYHPFVGYRIRQGKISLYFSAGYKFQTLTYEEIPSWGLWNNSSMKKTVVYDMERVSIQMGIGLN